VPLEIIFDQSLGRLFVIRIAGNIVDNAALGSMEYAVNHLHVGALIVLGHQDCGAVKEALNDLSEHVQPPPHLDAVLDPILPALSQGMALDAAIRANIFYQANQIIMQSPVLNTAVNKNKLQIFQGYYSMDTGLVEFF
jgi:carbonic anhydrase